MRESIYLEAGEEGASLTAPSATQADAGMVVASFFDQVNAKNVDAAVALFADGFIVNWGTSGTFMDKSSLKAFLNSQTSRGIAYQTSKVQVTQNTFVDLWSKRATAAPPHIPKVPPSSTAARSASLLSSKDLRLD